MFFKKIITTKKIIKINNFTLTESIIEIIKEGSIFQDNQPSLGGKNAGYIRKKDIN